MRRCGLVRERAQPLPLERLRHEGVRPVPPRRPDHFAAVINGEFVSHVSFLSAEARAGGDSRAAMRAFLQKSLEEISSEVSSCNL